MNIPGPAQLITGTHFSQDYMTGVYSTEGDRQSIINLLTVTEMMIRKSAKAGSRRLRIRLRRDLIARRLCIQRLRLYQGGEAFRLHEYFIQFVTGMQQRVTRIPRVTLWDEDRLISPR